MWFSNVFKRCISWALTAILLSGESECHRTWFMLVNMGSGNGLVSPNQSRPRSIMPYGITRPQRAKTMKYLMHTSPWSGWSLVQAMACCVFGIKPLPELMPTCQLNCCEQTSGKNEPKFWFSFKSQDSIFDNIVCKLSAILFGPQSVNNTCRPFY